MGSLVEVDVAIAAEDIHLRWALKFTTDFDNLARQKRHA